MDKIKSLDELEIMTPKELGKLLLYEVYKSRVDVQYIKDIIAAGAPLEVRDTDGWTALHWAASYGHIEVMKVLIASGADIDDHKTYIGSTPLHIAASVNKTKAVELLIASGASLDIQDEEGHTPLHVAAMNDYVGIAIALVAAGASKEILNNYNETPWDLVDDYDIEEDFPELNPNYSE